MKSMSVQAANFDPTLGIRYGAYGIAIRSQIPLPEFSVLPQQDESCDAEVRYVNAGAWLESVRHEPSFWSIQSREARFWSRGVGGFHVREGREILVSPESGTEESLLRMYVEGMMMACLLQQRGFYVLHGSVVQIADYAVAFLGHIGAGKSSMAAALHARGYAVVADDNAAVDFTPNGPLVMPAFPSVKIFPEIAISLGFEDRSLKVMHASQIKKSRSVSRAFPERPLPLRRVYVLNRSDEIAGPSGIARLAPAQALLELIRNSVPTRWRQPGDANHLAQCARLSRLIPAWRVKTFDQLSDIPELARRIEEHSQRETDSYAGNAKA
jgi:hypothetical protein